MRSASLRHASLRGTPAREAELAITFGRWENQYLCFRHVMNPWNIILNPWSIFVFAIVSFFVFYFIGKRDTPKR